MRTIALSFLRMLVGVGVVAAMFVASPVAADPQRFPTAQAAMDALLTALGAGDRKAVLQIFGEENADFLTGGDEAAARVEWRNVYTSAKEATVLRPDGDGRYIPVVGRRAWPMPIPIVRSDKGAWYFDTAAGMEEVTNRRIGRNELAAIGPRAQLRRCADATMPRADHDGDQVLEYAQRLISTARPAGRALLGGGRGEQARARSGPMSPRYRSSWPARTAAILISAISSAC